jgi:pre-mRNA-processing factor 19
VQSFEATEPKWARSSAYKRCAALTEDDGEEAQTILYGNEDGTAVIHRTDGPVFEVSCGSRITDALVWEGKAVFSLASGAIKFFEAGQEVKSYTTHAGSSTSISLHPCGTLLASVGSDRSYALYDLSASETRAVARVFTDSGI